MMKSVSAKAVLPQVKAFLQDDEAATAAEYGILAALIAVAIIGAVQAFGGNLTTMFGRLSQAIAGA